MKTAGGEREWSPAVRAVGPGDREWLRTNLRSEWGSERVVTRGRVHQADELPGFIAEIDREPIGYLIYAINGEECEIIVLHSTRGGAGAGSALLAAVRRAAKKNGCRALRLITTNDNTAAVRFYRKRGFRLVAVHRDAVTRARRLKPEIPEIGRGGVPIRDEIEFEMLL
ncbi:MAG TPA: GNAT family N-acetyltransferase [Bacteroidetes bacterium]|nr:GNAT family N-acetyltransferase [Bacteroidota bacterium]